MQELYLNIFFGKIIAGSWRAPKKSRAHGPAR
jgi:hypothetical protein